MIKKTILVLFIMISQMTFSNCSKSTTPNSENNNKTAGKETTKKLNKNILDLTVKTMDGSEIKLSDYKGKVLMIVNVASKCGYTSQYEGLETIYKKYKDKGFEILAFPCNDFGGQEPGTNEEIMTFCESKYNVTFKLFDKIKVLGENKSSLYERLTENSDPSGDIDWNFEKFIIDKNGDISGRYRSKVKPDSDEIIKMIEEKLN